MSVDQATAPPDSELLDAAEAAVYLRCSVRTIRKLTGKGLPHLRVGRRVFFPRGALARWVEDNTRQKGERALAPVPYIRRGRIHPAHPASRGPRPPDPPQIQYIDPATGRVRLEGLT